MGDKHDRALVIEQVFFQPVDGIDIEMVGRLIEQQQVGLAGERARQHHLAADAAGAVGEPLVLRKVQTREHGFDSLIDVPTAEALDPGLQARQQKQRFAIGHAVTMGEVVILGQQLAKLAGAAGDDFKHRLVGVGRYFLFQMGDAQRVGAPDLAVVGKRISGDYPKQRRLAGAVAPDQTDPLAGIDLKTDLGQEWNMAVGVGNIIETK